MKIPADSCSNLHTNLCSKVYIYIYSHKYCSDKKSRKLAIMQKVESSIVLPFRQYQVPFYVGYLFLCAAGAYQCNVVQKDAYVHGSYLLWVPIILS